MKSKAYKLWQQHKLESREEGTITLNLICTMDWDKRTKVEAEDGYSVHCSQKPTKYWKTPLHGESIEMTIEEGEQYFKDLKVRMYHNDRNDAHCRAKGIPTFDEWLEDEPTIDDFEWEENFDGEYNAEEVKISKRLRRNRFLSKLVGEWESSSVMEFFKILENNDHSEWEELLIDKLGLMDMPEAKTIIDAYIELPEELSEFHGEELREDRMNEVLRKKGYDPHE
jgi:hypothetical protein